MKIQRAPVGLGSFFRIFGGVGPVELNDKINGSVDLTDMYGSSLLQVTNDAAGAGIISRVVAGVAQAPGRLLHMSGVAVLGAAAGTFLKVSLLFAPNGATPPATVGSTIITVGLVAAATVRFGAPLTKPIVFNPGAFLQVEFVGDAGGADHTLFGRHLIENFTL